MRLMLLCAIAVAAPLSTANAVAYTFTTLDVPGAATGTFNTEAYGINNAGQVVGQYPVGGVGLKGFLFDSASGTYTTINEPATARATVAQGINNAGQIVGFVPFIGVNRTFLRDPVTGAFTFFSLPPSAMNALAADINDAGEIVGIFGNGSVSTPSVTSYLRNTDGTVTLISDPKSKVNFYDGSTVVTGINNSGLVSGYYNTRFTIAPESFLFDPTTGNFAYFSDPEATSTIAQGLNNVGQVVGTSIVGQVTNSFLFDRATNSFTILADPDGVTTSVADINDLGQIVGSYVDRAGVSHAFLATPVAISVPEPGTIALLGAGLFGLGVLRSRRPEAS